MSKTFLILVAIYLGIGFAAGGLMKYAIPPLNFFGVSYIAVTWPAQMLCVNKNMECKATPPQSISKYMFTFEEN